LTLTTSAELPEGTEPEYVAWWLVESTVKVKAVAVPPSGVRVAVTAVTVRVEGHERVNDRVPVPEAGARVTVAAVFVPAVMVTVLEPVRTVAPEESRPVTVKVQDPTARLVRVKDPVAESWLVLALEGPDPATW